MARDLIAAALDAIAIRILIVDEEMRIRHANAAALTLPIDRQLESTALMRAGDAIGCANSIKGSGTCGTSEACRKCLIRGSVQECLQTQRIVRERLLFEQVGTVGARHLLLTASPFEFEGLNAAVVTLEDATEVMELRGLLPLCARCRRVRHDSDLWERVEDYLDAHLGIDSSQSVCEECRRRR